MRPLQHRAVPAGTVALALALGACVPAAEAPTPTPTVAPVDTDRPTPPPWTAAEYAGQPPPGTVYWGASVPGNSDPGPRHEDVVRTQLGLRRSFFRWHHRTGWLIDTTRADLAAGRLPWVSIKPPGWEAMARGDHDAEVDELLLALDALDGPVWLTVHHEPDGGGRGNLPDDPAGPSAHVAMNARVRARLDALGVDNVALLPVLQAYTFNPTSGRDPDEWWEAGIYDLFGVDIYSREGNPADQRVWTALRTWAGERDMDVAVGEWGLLEVAAAADGDETPAATPEDPGEAAAAAMRAWYEHAVNSWQQPDQARVVALAYWDNESAEEDGWRLEGDRLAAFHDLLVADQSIAWRDLPNE